MFRAIAIAAALFAAAVALGGASTPGLTQDVAAECWDVAIDAGSGDTCQPGPGCVVAEVVGRATGTDPTCTM